MNKAVNNIIRINQGPHPTPRPSAELGSPTYEEIRISRLKLGAAAAVVAAIAVVGGIAHTSKAVFSKPPSIEDIKEGPIKAQADDFSPENSGIPTSGNEHE